MAPRHSGCHLLLASPHGDRTFFMNTNTLNTNSFSVGRFSLHSLSRRMDDGRYCASVAIRSGQGNATTGRILRFNDCFDTDAAAHAYAREQGLNWVANPGQPGNASN